MGYKFKARQEMRKRLYAKTTVLVLIVLAFLLGRGAWSVFQKNQESQKYQAQALEAVEELEARKEYLDSEIRRLESDHGVEYEMRSKFGVTKEGEKAVIIVSDEDGKNPSVVPITEKSWFSSIGSWFQ